MIIDWVIDAIAGHGGNMIALLDEINMVIVPNANPQYDSPVGQGWEYESAIIELVGKFIKSIPRA